MIPFNLIPARPLVILAVALIALGAATFAAPRDASANVPDPTGVFCAELPSVGGIVLVRMELDFDPNDGNPNDIAFTAVQYVPRGTANCQTAGSPINPNQLSKQTADRPTIPDAKYNPATNELTGSICQEDLEFGGVELPGWTEIEISFTFTDPGDGKTADVDAFKLLLGGDPETCAGATGLDIPIEEGLWLDGPGGDPNTFSSNWDDDGCTDWDELAEFGATDPFNPDDCVGAGAVGGVAEIVDPAAAPLGAEASSSGTSAWLIAAVAAAAVAGATAFGGAALFARRRIDR